MLILIKQNEQFIVKMEMEAETSKVSLNKFINNTMNGKWIHLKLLPPQLP